MICQSLRNQKQNDLSVQNVDNSCIFDDGYPGSKPNSKIRPRFKEILDRLTEGKYHPGRKKESYFFFNEDEIDVQNYIKKSKVSLDDRLGLGFDYNF